MSNFSVQNQASERETGEKIDITRAYISSSFSGVESNQVSPIALEQTKVKEGLDFILSHFSEPLFPRKIAAGTVIKKTHEVDSKERALLYYEGMLWEDCRINAFGLDQKNPDLIFIELDAKDFCSHRALKMALTNILKRINKKLGGHPTVYWSGRGYHIIQPINCSVTLDEIKEFAALTDDGNVNKEFLQFAERYLSNGKCDKSNNPAIKSCLLRVPGSLNSKCEAAGVDAEVKIIRRWDGYRPSYRLLIGSFHADLKGRYEEERSKYQGIVVRNYALGHDSGPIGWIEKLLQTPIDDFRKRSRDLILVPYLMVRRGMTDVDQITQIIMKWADRCAELYKLEPSRREYEKEIRSRVYEVMRERIPYMRLETLKEKNPDLYRQLYVPI